MVASSIEVELDIHDVDVDGVSLGELGVFLREFVLVGMPGTLSENQARKQAIEDIARVYGIPPYVLFSEAGTAYTAEQARMYADSLATYTDAWQSELTSKLYPGQDVKVCFDTTQLMRGSFGESMSAYKEAIQLGVMTPNEVRMELGLTPMEGGDQMYVGPNMQPGGTTDGTGVPPTDGADDIEPDDG